MPGSIDCSCCAVDASGQVSVLLACSAQKRLEQWYSVKILNAAAAAAAAAIRVGYVVDLACLSVGEPAFLTIVRNYRFYGADICFVICRIVVFSFCNHGGFDMHQQVFDIQTTACTTATITTTTTLERRQY